MKKRTVVMAALAALTSSPAMAQSCPSGSSLALSVIGWSVREADGPGSNLAAVLVTLRNNLNVGFRLIDGSVRFSDVLGANHSSIEIDRASTAIAGGTLMIDGVYAGRAMLQVAAMHRDDVVVTACTNAVVTMDGEVITAPRPPGAAAPLSTETIESLRQAIMRCWSPPIAAMLADVAVILRVGLQPNGSLAGTPVIVSSIATSLEQATALAAQRAAQQCAPYSFMPEESYEHWREVTLTFRTTEI